MSEINISTGHPDAVRVYADAHERVKAERDALQQLLNASDQQVDDAATENNERELSRRSWFDETRRLEQENEGLKADIKLLKSDLRIANDTAALGAKMLAERDALLRDLHPHVRGCEPDLWGRLNSALSASSEPKSCGASAGCMDGCRVDRESPPVECDDPAALLDEALSGGDWVFYVRPLIVKARAALENVAKPIERDERADFEVAYSGEYGTPLSVLRLLREGDAYIEKPQHGDRLNSSWWIWQARAALERKP